MSVNESSCQKLLLTLDSKDSSSSSEASRSFQISSQSLSKLAINSCRKDEPSQSLSVKDYHPLLYQSSSADFPLTRSTTLKKKTFLTSDELEADIEREMRIYRCKHIFCQSCRVFCQSCRGRFPSEKSVYLVLLLCLLERVAYYNSVGNILKPFLYDLYPGISPAIQALLFSVFMDMLAQLLFPLFGWIADARVGRYNMLNFSMWFLWLSYGLMTLVFTFDGQISWNRYLLPIWMTVINIGSAGFQANAIPFGADQIMYGTSEHISSFFYWYYWVRNFGSIFLSLSFTCRDPYARWYGYLTFGLVSTVCMSVALVLNSLKKGWFFVDNKRQNPIWNIIKIFFAAMVAKRPRVRSAFSYSNLPAPTRMDLTKRVHGGKFDSEEVENAKTVGRVLTVVLSMSGALIVYRGVINIIGIQVRGMKDSPLLIFNTEWRGHCHFDSDFTWILNSVVVLITIPVLNQCIVPFLREYRPSMLAKIVIGYVLVVLSSVCIVAIIESGDSMLQRSGGHDHRGHHNHSENISILNHQLMCIFSDLDSDNYIKLPIPPWTVLIPHMLMSVAEVFIIVSCLQFCYAQSPHNMRGLMIGFFFFIWGFSDTIATTILTLFSLRRVGPPESCNFWYHIILLVIGVIAFVVYLIVARCYRNRKRPISNENYVYYNLMK